MDALNSAMNKVSSVVNMEIAGEKDITHYNEEQIQSMVGYK